MRKAEFSGRAASLRKHPNGRGLRPSTPRVTRTRAGRPKNLPSGPHGHLLPPRHCTLPWVRTTLGSPRPLHPSSLTLIPAAQDRPDRSPSQRLWPVPQFAPPAVRAGVGAGNSWGRGPWGEATRHSRVELLFILSPPPSPLPHEVTRSPRSLRLGSGHFRAAQGTAERWRFGRVGGGYPDASS